ncbi:MAG: hypothetical protein ABFD69_16250 [Candidatus Sumerlaeia bacterium]
MRSEPAKPESQPAANRRPVSILLASILCWAWGALTLVAASFLMRTGGGQHFLEYFIIMLLAGAGLVYAGWAALKMRPWSGWFGIAVSILAAALYCLFPYAFLLLPWIPAVPVFGPLTIISILASNLSRIQNPAAPARNALARFALFELAAIGIMAAVWFWTAPRTATHADEPGRFSRNPNGIVVDTITGLEWYLDPGPITEWESAMKWASALNLDGGGFRLPTSSELAGLYQNNPTGSHIDPAFAAPEKFNYVWTSTRHDGRLIKLLGGSSDIVSMAGIYYFHSGGKGWNHIGPGHKCYAMAVRPPKATIK